ncbi:MAG: HD-GYP domain-containing protein [Planctomycetes bacterium]|nr:HD-GYP domain-containing protein [Planctomycetota bacterium]
MDRDIIEALIRVVEVKDACTAAHTWRVALYTQLLSEAAGLDPDEVLHLMYAAVLHDIGKIDIPYRILTKPGRLTAAEFEIVKTHTVLGYDRLRRMDETDPVTLAFVRSHHERLDGSGYPDGLSGAEIPIAARCFAVVDTFDAMTSIRPYRRHVGPEAAEKALAVLKAEAGTRYCPDAVELLAARFDSGELDWILSYFNDEQPMVSVSSYDAPVIATAGRELSRRWRSGKAAPLGASRVASRGDAG